MHTLSIVTVNWKAPDFLQLLIESAERFTSIPYEFICIDNSEVNRGHGEGLNLGSQQATGDFIMFVDVDCHFLKRGWEQPFLKALKEYDVVAGKGVPAKPIRPACMCLKAEIAKKYDWASTPGYQGHRITPDGYDVAIKAYYEMVKDGVKIKLIEPMPNRYGTLNGEEWGFDSPLLYHNWHGCSLNLPCRQADFPGIDLNADKELLFSKIPWRLP